MLSKAFKIKVKDPLVIRAFFMFLRKIFWCYVLKSEKIEMGWYCLKSELTYRHRYL